MSAGFGIYKNVMPWPVMVKLPAKNVASVPPGHMVVLADSWPGVQEAMEQRKIVRLGDASSDEPLVVLES